MSRGSVAVRYPSKKSLTGAEIKAMSQRGPELRYFEPWAEHGVPLPAGAAGEPFRCGYVHLTGKENEEPEVHLFHDREGLAHELEDLYRTHPQHEDGCQVWYFTPDEPIRLRMVIEVDDSEDQDETAPEASK